VKEKPKENKKEEDDSKKNPGLSQTFFVEPI